MLPGLTFSRIRAKGICQRFHPRGQGLGLPLLGQIPHILEIRMPEQCIVVHVHLGIQTQEITGISDHQGVDLQQ